MVDISDLTEDEISELVDQIVRNDDLVRRIVSRMDLVNISGVARALGLSVQRVKVMRTNGQDGPEGRVDVLPQPLELPGRFPIWPLSEILRWGKQTGRLTPEGTPRRLLPPGRTPRRASVAA